MIFGTQLLIDHDFWYTAILVHSDFYIFSKFWLSRLLGEGEGVAQNEKIQHFK